MGTNPSLAVAGEGGASFRDTLVYFPYHTYACSFPSCGRAFRCAEELVDHVHQAGHSPQAPAVLERISKADPQLIQM